MTATLAHAGCEPYETGHTGRILVEPLEPGDVETVLAVFDGLGPKSRALRFLTAKPRLTGADLRALSDVDGRDRVAVVARLEGRPIGIARFVRDAEDRGAADVAVAVVDAWQDRWVGTRLAHALLDRAQELGIDRFTMAVSQDNEAALRLMRRIAGDVTPIGLSSGSAEFVVSIGGPSSGPAGVRDGVSS